MGYFVLERQEFPVSGEVVISGAKNAALPLLAAAVICEKTVLDNCPLLSDTLAAQAILDTVGFDTFFTDNTFTVGGCAVPCTDIPQDLCGSMRSSVLFVAPLAARFGHAVLCTPGGCRLGARPIDLHLMALERLGAKISYADGKITVSAPNGFTGADIYLGLPSVGATETAVLAAACAAGTTVIHSPALEPEIEDLCTFLNAAGADISFGSTIKINGKGGLLKGAVHTVIPDRIEAGTYLLAAAVTGGELFLKNVCPQHLQAVTDMLEKMGCHIKSDTGTLYIDAPLQLYNPHDMSTAPYPLMPTDLQPQFTALFAAKTGSCTVTENIFEGRCGHIPQLVKMGADISVHDDRTFTVHGIGKCFNTAALAACDLRCGAALILAALNVKQGRVVIKNSAHILRGYENICAKMEGIGVEIKHFA